MRVIIVGGSAAGVASARRVRELDESAEVVLVERTGHIAYDLSAVPAYVAGRVEGTSPLAPMQPEDLATCLGIDVRCDEEVTAIDRGAKRVTVSKLRGARGKEATYELAYDKLILATGARPMLPAALGTGSPQLFPVHAVEDAMALSRLIDRLHARSAAVVGGGPTGVQMAEALAQRGLAVTLLQRPAQLMPHQLDPDIAMLLQRRLAGSGIEVRCGVDVTNFAQQPREGMWSALRIEMAGDEQPVTCDVAVCAVGEMPEGTLASQAGIELGAGGSVACDAHLATSDPDVFVAGASAQVTDVVTGGMATMGHAGSAVRQGRVAAENACGVPSTYDGGVRMAVLDVCGRHVAAAGITCAEADATGLDFDFVTVLAPEHGPSATRGHDLVLKVVFERPTGRVIGAQAIGSEAAERLADVASAAIRARMTVADLAGLDQGASPEGIAAPDPLCLAGTMAGEVLGGLVRQVHADEVDRLVADQDVAVIDVRTKAEHDHGHLPGDRCIPYGEARRRLSEFPQGKRLLVYCKRGRRSYAVCRMLAQRGVSCVSLDGGYDFYRAAKGAAPVARPHAQAPDD